MAGRAGANTDTLIVGAGPAGLQLAYYLHKAGADYLVLEAGETPGTFFRTFPRHRTLISINKTYVGPEKPEPALRYDWNSLLSDDDGLRLGRYSSRYFPSADDLLRYLADFAEAFDLKICYGTNVAWVGRKSGDTRFTLIDEEENEYTARRLVVATGFGKPYIPPIPGIEHAELYWDFPTSAQRYADERVLIIGKGNSAFETAESLTDTAATIHLASPHQMQFAWRSRYVGHLRAVNNNFLDTYHLKSQNALLDAEVRDIERVNGQFLVNFAYTHGGPGERTRICYDRVIACTGFRLDDSIFSDGVRPTLCHDGRFPAQSSIWESVNVPGLYFAGALMHARDYQRTMSGFIHGFRYNIRFLAQLFTARDHDRPLSYDRVPADADLLTELVLDRLNTSSAMFLQPGYLCDAFIWPSGGGGLRHYRDIPVDYVYDSELSAGRWCSLSLEFGPQVSDPFAIQREADPAWARYAPFIRPVLRLFHGTVTLGELYLIEDLENHYSASRFGAAIHDFVRSALAQRSAA
jgi:thioredoxin reductase